MSQLRQFGLVQEFSDQDMAYMVRSMIKSGATREIAAKQIRGEGTSGVIGKGSLFSARSKTRALNALGKVIREGEGSSASFYHQGIGNIILDYGIAGDPQKNYKDGYGAIHMLVRRMSEGHSLDDAVDIVSNAIIAASEGAVTKSYRDRIDVSLNGYTAVLAKDRSGRKETWVISGYKKYADADSKHSHLAKGYAPVNFDSRQQVVAAFNRSIDKLLKAVNKKDEGSLFSVRPSDESRADRVDRVLDQEKIILDEPSDMTANEIFGLLPWNIHGNKGAIMADAIGKLLERISLMSNRVIDAFGGAASFTHYLAKMKADHNGDMWNEYDPLRFIATDQVAKNHEEVKIHVRNIEARINDILDRLTGKYASKIDEKSFQVEERIAVLNFFDTELSKHISEGQDIAAMKQQLETFKKKQGPPPEPIMLNNNAEVAALYYIMQAQRFGTRGIQSEISNSPGRTFQLMSRDEVGIITVNDGKTEFWGQGKTRIKNAERIIDAAHERLKNKKISRGDGWSLIRSESKEGDLILVDPSYLGKGTLNYNAATVEDANLLVLMDKITKNVLTAWDKGAKVIITNNYDSQLAQFLLEEGFNVQIAYRGSKDGTRTPELVATNFDPHSGKVYSRGVIRNSDDVGTYIRQLDESGNSRGSNGGTERLARVVRKENGDAGYINRGLTETDQDRLTTLAYKYGRQEGRRQERERLAGLTAEEQAANLESVIPTKDVKGIIRENTGQKTVSKLIGEDQALWAAMKKAEQGARIAFREGRREEAAKYKAEIKKAIMQQHRVVNVAAMKELHKIENLRQAMQLPTPGDMTTEQLDFYVNTLMSFEDGDTFLGKRQIETVMNVPGLEDIKTWREAKEALLRDINKDKPAGGKVTMQELSAIRVKEIDIYRYDSSLRDRNPFYKMMVEETHRELLEAEARFHQIENDIRALADASEKSRNLGMKDKLIHQDRQIFEWLESDLDMRESLSSMMTPEQLKLAEYMQSYFVE